MTYKYSLMSTVIGDGRVMGKSEIESQSQKDSIPVSLSGDLKFKSLGQSQIFTRISEPCLKLPTTKSEVKY